MQVCKLENRSFVKITGSDSAMFLQGLLTNDINKQNFIYSLLLTPQGKYLYELFILKQYDNYLIELFEGHKGSFMSKLKLYRLRSKVEIEDVSDEYVSLFSTAPIAHALISELDPRYNMLKYRSIIASSKSNDFITESKCSHYTEIKYQFAVPDYMDLIQDKSFPLEFGFDRLNAIDFNKGCYVGQEPISRTKHLGVVRKNIYKIEAQTDLSTIPQNTEILGGTELIGKFCSGYKNLGIAQIRTENLEKAQETNSTITVNGIQIKVTVPEWRKA